MREVLLLFVSSLLVCASHAQQSVDFDDALSLMVEHNASIESAGFMVDAAEYEWRAAKGLRSPTLDLNAGYMFMQRDVAIDFGGAKGIATKAIDEIIGKGIGSGVITPEIATLLTDGISPLLAADWRYTLQNRSVGVVGLQLSMPIYAGGRINAAIKAADRRREIEFGRFEATINRQYTTLVERFYGVVLLRSVVDVRHEVVVATEHHLADAIAMEEAGVMAHSDVLLVEYRLAEARQKLVAAREELVVAERALSVVIGEDCRVDDDIELFVSNDIKPLEYYLKIAIDINPILACAEAEHELANIGVKAARSELFPEVVAMGAASLYGYELSDLLPRWAVGIGLNFSIFDGVRKERKLKAAQMVEQGVGALVKNGRDELCLLIEKEYSSVSVSLAKYNSLNIAIGLAKTMLNNAQDGFEAGVVSSSELIDARLNLAAAHIDVINAAYDHCCSLARLLEAAGVSADFIVYQKSGVLVNIDK